MDNSKKVTKEIITDINGSENVKLLLEPAEKN